ncbi:DNA-binding Lrp family transcriptional regulator [Rhodococcus sp. 27YEA15]|uniref:Lrp/AsnC family transcriptional regulator n=1 Tax=Rhodococcus sp. 27YEA15 TaxID=3156259 RepID=UPI003C7B314E
MNEKDIRPRSELTESDIQLIDAMQSNPRASWAQLGKALAVSPVTAMRRWQRLEDAGEAWVSVAFGPRQQSHIVFAFIEVMCDPGAVLDSASELGRMSHVITIVATSGDFDLFAIVFAEDLDAMSTLLLEDIPAVPGVRRLRSNVGTQWYGGTRWRLDAINAEQAQQLRETGVDNEPGEIRPLDVRDRALFAALSRDGRMAYTDLARELDQPVITVKRRLNRLQRAGDVIFRCDLARSMVGLHAMAIVWLSVPDVDIDEVARTLSSWPECRLCASVVGRQNIIFAAGLNSIPHLTRVISRMQKMFPTTVVGERSVGIRPVKIYGRILDAEGRCAHTIPIDLWPQT